MVEHRLTNIILKAAFRVHQQLGPGLMKQAYQHCLLHELRGLGLTVESHKDMPVTYKGQQLSVGYTLDLLVEKKIIIQLTAAPFTEMHNASMQTYLKMSDCKLGLLMHFDVRSLKDGVRRVLADAAIMPSMKSAS